METEVQKSQIHRCGLCEAEFPTEEAYCGHTCEKTGLTPTEPGHHGEEFKAIQEAALARGEEKRAPGEDTHTLTPEELPSNK